MPRPGPRLLVPLLLAAWAGTPAGVAAQRVGLCYDLQASVCSATIEPFDPYPGLQVYVFVFPPPGVDLRGLGFRLQLPSGIRIFDPPGVMFPHNLYFDVRGSVETGYDARFAECTNTTDPILVAQFSISDVSLVPPPHNNMVLHLAGSVLDSLQAADKPRLIICDPTDPDRNLGYVTAPSVDAYLNCTQSCGCTTAIVPRTWSALKSLYREP